MADENTEKQKNGGTETEGEVKNKPDAGGGEAPKGSEKQQETKKEQGKEKQETSNDKIEKEISEDNNSGNGKINIEKLTLKEAQILLKQYIEDVETLEKAMIKAQAAIAETKNDYLRARADCENVKRHKAEEVNSAYCDGKLEAVTKVLPIGDSLDWALKMPMEEKTKEGIELLLKKYHESLVQIGITEFSPEAGSAFDPKTAAAVMQVEPENDKEKQGTIKQVYGRGFKLGDKIIRYAQVSVIK